MKSVAWRSIQEQCFCTELIKLLPTYAWASVLAWLVDWGAVGLFLPGVVCTFPGDLLTGYAIGCGPVLGGVAVLCGVQFNLCRGRNLARVSCFLRGVCPV